MMRSAANNGFLARVAKLIDMSRHEAISRQSGFNLIVECLSKIGLTAEVAEGLAELAENSSASSAKSSESSAVQVILAKRA